MENPYIVIEQKDEKKHRGALAIILTIAFCAILAVGGTFAYLTWTTNKTPNRFTTDYNVTADLLEPAWTNAITTAGDTAAYASDNTLIPAAANDMVPGVEVAKNPFVVNTTKDGDETTSGVKAFGGIKLQFQKWVANTAGSGTGSSHTETGDWVNMTANEVDKLMAVYAFTTATGSSTTTAGINTTDNALGTNWVQIINGTDQIAQVQCISITQQRLQQKLLLRLKMNQPLPTQKHGISQIPLVQLLCLDMCVI